MADDGIIWEKVVWHGRWYWFINRLEGEWGLGPRLVLDPHPDSSNTFIFHLGPWSAGVQVFHSN